MKASRIRAVVFDIDETLTESVSWTVLTRGLGASVSEHVELHRAMKAGHISLTESKSILLKRWLGAPVKPTRSAILRILADIPLRSDAERVVGELKGRGYTVGLISGSMDCFVQMIANRLQIRYYYANSTLIFDDLGTLHDFTYFADQEHVKMEHMREFLESTGVALREVLAVGDGANDIELFRSTRNGVLLSASGAPTASRSLRNSARHTITNLTQILDLLR